MLIFLGVWFGVGIALMIIFHFFTREKPVTREPEELPKARPAEFLPKKDARNKGPSYDYQRTTNMGNPVLPIEPGDTDPPEPYE